ncbi:MAG: helix-turn-helix domain-containing protein [Acetobacteraceae bacterium]
MIDTVAIGQRIRDVRQAKGMTQDQLARAVHVSRSAVAQWETGRAGQVTANLSRLAQTLGIGVEYLTHGEDKFAPATINRGDEFALLRLYRECGDEDRQLLLRMARRLATQRSTADPS